MPRVAKEKPNRVFRRKGPLPKLVTPTAIADPMNINARLYRQVGLLLDDLEKHDHELELKERIQALIAIGRVQTIFVGLRKENKDGGPRSGSAVRKYSTAFKNDARRGAVRARSIPDDTADDFVRDDIASDGDDAA